MMKIVTALVFALALISSASAAGIDSLFTAKFDATGKRSCAAFTAPAADDKYVNVAVLLPVVGNEAPNGQVGTPTYTFEVVEDPTTARSGSNGSVLSVQDCTFGTDGKSVWYKVQTKRVKNNSDDFFGTVIPLTTDQVQSQVPFNVKLDSGTYHGKWTKAGDNPAVVFEKVGQK